MSEKIKPFPGKKLLPEVKIDLLRKNLGNLWVNINQYHRAAWRVKHFGRYQRELGDLKLDLSDIQECTLGELLCIHVPKALIDRSCRLRGITDNFLLEERKKNEKQDSGRTEPL